MYKILVILGLFALNVGAMPGGGPADPSERNDRNDMVDVYFVGLKKLALEPLKSAITQLPLSPEDLKFLEEMRKAGLGRVVAGCSAEVQNVSPEGGPSVEDEGLDGEAAPAVGTFQSLGIDIYPGALSPQNVDDFVRWVREREFDGGVLENLTGEELMTVCARCCFDLTYGGVELGAFPGGVAAIQKGSRPSLAFYEHPTGMLFVNAGGAGYAYPDNFAALPFGEKFDDVYVVRMADLVINGPNDNEICVPQWIVSIQMQDSTTSKPTHRLTITPKGVSLEEAISLIQERGKQVLADISDLCVLIPTHTVSREVQEDFLVDGRPCTFEMQIASNLNITGYSVLGEARASASRTTCLGKQLNVCVTYPHNIILTFEEIAVKSQEQDSLRPFASPLACRPISVAQVDGFDLDPRKSAFAQEMHANDKYYGVGESRHGTPLQALELLYQGENATKLGEHHAARMASKD